MLSANISPLLAFIAAACVLTITPGVDTAMVLRSSASNGPIAGVAASAGICAGLLVWGAAAALGLTAILAASPVAFTALKGAGAVYLLCLGAKLIAKPRSALDVADSAGRTRGQTGVGDALRRGFLTNMLNPKVGIFYATFLPQFVPPEANSAGFSLLLAGIHVLLTSLWFSMLIALTVPLAGIIRKPLVVKLLDQLTGCIFVAFGVRLAVAHRG
ncbi:LysE family translocator [Rhodoblastus sp. 17X3]|uniref:LysE family translocator n=1 Tax=Rhodoblastus sp. 17X3 TaxID=3047026 RepID=UPI0024B698EF|nr:LysE family translocator [Rhodoblastus sp. 17X3]MDI9849999.1 LysE family translocator [Rhodoblastus sp. 17X3]